MRFNGGQRDQENIENERQAKRLMLHKEDKLVFTFPGQGSFHLALLGDLYDAEKPLRKFFYIIDEAASDILGVPFLPLVLGDSTEKNRRLSEYPDLDQLGIYLGNYAAAQLWLRQEIYPDLLLGHSFGELAAFTVAGIYNFEQGARIVCQRVLSLREHPGPGRMLAVAAPSSQVEATLKKFARVASVSVINHSGQTVVSGQEEELSQLRTVLAQEGVSVTPLKSRYPFHSSLLAPASRVFGVALRGYRFGTAEYPVLMGTEQCLVDRNTDVAEVMARQLVTPLNFEAAVRRLVAEGCTRFLECGGGTTLTSIVGKVMKQEKGHREWATFPVGRVVNESIRSVCLELSSRPASVSIQKTSEIAAPVPAVNSESGDSLPEQCGLEPIAIVSMGCVLPGGANDPDQYWQNITAGVSGIVDLAAIDSNAHHDFVAAPVDANGNQRLPDKTYTLLNGSILRIAYSAALLDDCYSRSDFELLAKGQKILALAMAQARLRSKSNGKQTRIQCILGSTADGWMELDEAHFCASMREWLDQLDEPVTEKENFTRQIRTRLPGWDRNPEESKPHQLCAAVAQRLLGISPDNTYLVDSACSSSLYSLALGARALRAGEVDLVYAGGIFAPGPANNNFFAQFGGLTATESRPFDAKADGVVFGDGAGIVALKRLRDAVDDGDVIHGVVRAEGFSSDGKSPSINVPQAEGQRLAIQSAYEQSGLDPRSVQYIEAHATATPVGDAVEFKALRESMPSPLCADFRYIGSVKALIGHTGWASGVASVIKICKAFKHRRIPKQFGYDQPNPNIEFAGSGFAVPSEEVDWPENAGGLPRRAACNGFGFGGTNAHFVLEEYRQSYHTKLAAVFRDKPPTIEEIVVVAVEGLLPDLIQGTFERKHLRMPTKRPVLPDVAEHMDASQYLATITAEKVISNFSKAALEANLRIGVALGLESKTERGVRANERVFLDRLERIALEGHASHKIVTRIREAILRTVIPSGPYTLPGLMPNVAASRITYTFNWHGPNIVVDRGTSSLLQALETAVKFVRARDCDLALAGGVNAWMGHSHAAREAVALVAIAGAEAAAKHKLPVLARLQFENGSVNGLSIKMDADPAYRGATGSVELLNCMRDALRKSIPATLVFNDKPFVTLVPAGGVQMPAEQRISQPASEPRGSHAYVQGTPITNYTHIIVDADPVLPPSPLVGRSYLFLVDQPEAWNEFARETALHDLSYHVAVPAGVNIPGATAIDASSEDLLIESLAQLQSFTYDTVVAIKQLAFFSDEDLLLQDFDTTRGLLDALFGICRHRYQDISAGRCAITTICLGALRTGEVDAYTGLFGGFIKSICRELPGSTCRAVITDEKQISTALRQAVAEVEAGDKIPEVVYKQGRRLRIALAESPLHREGEQWVHPDSVVLATGGGRGVTAVLVEHLLEGYGCTVIALGRTDPQALPENLLHLDAAAFQQYEPHFYRNQLAANGSKKMPELKKLYEQYQASHEVASMVRRCQTLQGRFEYIQCDINDSLAVDRIVADILGRYGRLDMVLHGAGVQVSKVLPRKQLTDFQRTVSTKLASLCHLYRACHKRDLHQRVSFHILTSAFSYLGNDGQPDYGAANEAMNRIAVQLMRANPKPYWSSLAWLGWAGVGMTRGTEYAALAASRRLRGVTAEEGKNIFADAMLGPPASSVNILLAEGEVAFYSPAIRKPSVEDVVEWPLSLEAMPFLSDHVVRGIPTLPGSFLIAMAADAAHKLLPDLKIVQFERTRFLRLVRAQQGRADQVKAVARIVEHHDDQTVVQVQILMDFVHKSGRVLGKDLLHTEIYVRMASSVRRVFHSNGHPDGPGLSIPDPYVMEGSPVRLDGAFRAMKEVVVSQTSRHAHYRLNGDGSYQSGLDHLMPNVILVDAFWRFGTVCSSDRGLSVYVPERCDAMQVFFDYTDFGSDSLRGPVTFHGVNPRPEGDVLHVGPIEAFDANGGMLLRVEGGLCRKFGEIARS